MDRILDADLDAGLVPVRVETRYDRSIRSWTSFLVTEAGEQVGSAMFDGTRADRDASRASLERTLAALPKVCPDPSHVAYREAHDALAALVNRKPSELPNWQPTVVAELIIEDLQRALAAVVEAERGTARHFEAGCRSLPGVAA